MDGRLKGGHDGLDSNCDGRVKPGRDGQGSDATSAAL
jgi:hypothetical protein